MENIKNFLIAARKIGIRQSDLFETLDLYEGTGIKRVHHFLLTLAKMAPSIPTYRGPHFVRFALSLWCTLSLIAILVA